ncbi:MAG TPA: carboxypeptidase-like regulatory domain-containing protein, partial [Pyrinomonadaceae bacterium]|nr:carboxypeptidase-like regulatory domain-containing protein [Pyrinomonadaceae bacterium]
MFVLCLCAAPCARVAAAQENASARVRVGGVVRDEAGAPVRGAEVTIDAGRASARRAETGDDGRFVFDGLEAKEGTLRVRAGGFASRELRWGAGEGGAAEVSVVLAPAPLGERVTVTATRTDTAASETAASVTVVSAEALAATAAL